jgi:uncharacterized membrane protein
MIAMWAFVLFRQLHILAGFIALFTFWVPIVTKKGGKWHRRTGWIYVISMSIVAVSAFYMGAWRIFFDPSKSAESVSFAWFLIFIAVLSSASAWYGMRVLRFKRRSQSHRNRWDVGFPILLLVSGMSISIFGFISQNSLLAWFPAIGVFLGGSQLAYWLRPPRAQMHWWFEHLGGMLACCISTITAFIVFGAPRLWGSGSAPLLLWFLPTICLVPVIIGMNIYYRRRFKKSA